MNFVTHLFFSNESIDTTVGLLIGNTAKASNFSKYNLETLKGIAMDMQMRLFSENHPAFHRSIQRVHSGYNRKHAVFISNIFYDHFLVKNWDSYSRRSLEDFSESIYRIIQNNNYSFPYKIKKYASGMISKKWITGIASIEGTHQYIKMHSKNERFPANMEQCLFELIENYKEYNKDFDEYFTALCEFMEGEARRFSAITDEREIFLLSA